MLLRAAQARAVLSGRDFVLPDDVQQVAVNVVGHRVSGRGLSAASEDARIVVSELLQQTEVPV